MTTPGEAASLEGHFPDFFTDADQASLDGQRRYTSAVRNQLIGLLVAAVAGVFTWQINGSGADWFGILAAAAFAATVLQRGYLWQTRPDKEWYAGRAAAESAKTLTYRYAFCADPFPQNMNEHQAAVLFLDRLKDVRRKLGNVMVIPQPGGQGEITEGMRKMRHQPLATRKSTYLSSRIIEQRNWYSRKARFNDRRARLWSIFMVAMELAGFIGAVLKASNILHVDLLGLASAIVAATAAWMEMRQHNNLATAYSVAARELSEAHELGMHVADEGAWSGFVANAEEAISREHTMWAASRGH